MAVAEDALDPDARVAVSGGEPIARARLLARRPELARSLREQERAIESMSTLDPVVREIVILTVLRRSRMEFRVRRAVALERGVSEAMLDAILDEDWTDPVFGVARKSAFQFALQYDAGHLINDSVLSSIQENFTAGEIVELALVAGLYGAIARMAVGFRLDGIAG